MAKIERKTQKIFAGNAASDDTAAFGSMITGTPVYTDNIEALQTTAYEQGWSSAIAANEAPFLEEMNGVQYGLSKQIAYLLQNGVPEWDDGTTYYANTSFCQVNGVIYQSLTDDNIGNDPTTDTTNWISYYDPADFALRSADNTFTGNNTFNGDITSSGSNTFTGTNNFTSLLEYDGVEVANVDASNFSSTGTTTISGYGMPSSRYIDLTLGASGTTYTAPANGWYSFSKIAGVQNEYFILGNRTAGGMTVNPVAPFATATIRDFIPALKGQTISLVYTLTGSTVAWRFIYASGDTTS